MVGFLTVFQRQVYVFTFYQSSQNIVPEIVPPNCQILLLLTTDWFQTVSRPYIIFLVHSGLCLEKHANWFLGEVTELLLYTMLLYIVLQLSDNSVLLFVIFPHSDT